jgi:predicted unusual protein kinase regulating ubiquinone biosynthesis (AarF/ABC1/UbiB family)
MIRRFALGTASVTTGGVIMIREYIGRDNFDRTISFYRVAAPGYIIYRITDYSTRSSPPEERSAKFAELHKVWAPRALDKILELRGFYIKVGQMAASNIGNAFPDIWVRTMEVLQDNVPHKDIDSVRATIESSFGRPMEEIFLSFEPRPLGAASIGQVHRATLMDGVGEWPDNEDKNAVTSSWFSFLKSYLHWSNKNGAHGKNKREVVVKIQVMIAQRIVCMSVTDYLHSC